MSHEYILACSHVLEEFHEADSAEFPDLLCRKCVELSIESDKPTLEMHVVCKNCVKCSKVTQCNFGNISRF